MSVLSNNSALLERKWNYAYDLFFVFALPILYIQGHDLTNLYVPRLHFQCNIP